MNLKKIVLTSIILLIIMSSFSAVTAGWFDFLSDDSNDGPIDGKILKSSYNGKLIDKNGGIGTFEYDGFVDIDLTEASDSQINKIKDNLDCNNITLILESDLDDDLTINPESGIDTVLDLSLNGKTLTVNYSTGYISMIEDGCDDSGKVISGNITIPIEDQNITINFS